MVKRRFFTLLAVGALITPATDALAQYKNHSFGFDAGVLLIQKPSPYDSDNVLITNPSKRPLRLENGFRAGGETSFKMDEDHWWFVGRVNVGALQFAEDMAFDKAAADALGTLLGIQGVMGVRYLIFTDRVRPYLQLHLSYMRLMSFSSQAGQGCDTSNETSMLGCVSNSTYGDSYLPHANVGGVALQPGIEWLVGRDLALHLFTAVERWIIWGASDNNAVSFGFGVLFYT